MTTIDAVLIAVTWYALWGIAGYLHGRWYIRHLLLRVGRVPRFRPTAVVPALALAYTFAGIAPLLYPPFLNAATESSPLFYSLPAVVALSMLPALLKFHTANEMAERRKRNVINVAILPVELDRPQAKQSRLVAQR